MSSPISGGRSPFLGASALFNPHILLRSGINHPLTGRRLHEQMPLYVTLDLRGVKCYNGSTILSGLGYLFYEGEHRRDYAACMIETWSSPFGYRRQWRTEIGARSMDRTADVGVSLR
jgi:hypothetical protein